LAKKIGTGDSEMATRSKNGTAKRSSVKRSANAKDTTVSYNEFKEYEGRKYTGMRIGRSHTWRYDAGAWKETKVTPDLWQFRYDVTKRRAGHAPEGSGVPVGTEYHWYIVGHQNVCKLNANDYTTSLTGLKFKVAHKRADSGAWSATPATRRKRMINFLRQVIDDLEHPSATPEEESPSTPLATAKVRPSPTSRPKKTAVPRSMRKATRRRRSAVSA
jgi:hypothetical protein